jgi:hypothetical protein
MRWSSCCGWRSATSRTSEPENAPNRPAGPRTSAARPQTGRRRHRAGLERRLRRTQHRLPRPPGAAPVTGRLAGRGSLHDQPILAGAQPRSTQRLNPDDRSSLTAASTGTPSQLEEPRPPRPADRLTELVDEQEANTPLPINKINNTVYTADLTTSHLAVCADQSRAGHRADLASANQTRPPPSAATSHPTLAIEANP